ncbi:MAG: hypothetical protein LUC43_07765 [Burkholderiales bacterium]|nr:hypothetical protein [Burkholderiales bacterium]
MKLSGTYRRRLQTIVGEVFSYAQLPSVNLIPVEKQNPVYSKTLRMMLGKSESAIAMKARNLGALAYESVPEFVRDLVEEAERREDEGFPATAHLAILFAILTNSRLGNVIGSKIAEKKNHGLLWSQVDFENKLWTIPAMHMKQHRNGNHVVPLSSCALRVLEAMRDSATPRDEVFSRKDGRNVSTSTVGIVIGQLNQRRIERNLPPFTDRSQSLSLGQQIIPTVHGIARSSFRSWVGENSFRDKNGSLMDGDTKRAAAELNLHHLIASTKVEAAYLRSPYLDQRRILSESWGRYCFLLIDPDKYFPLPKDEKRDPKRPFRIARDGLARIWKNNSSSTAETDQRKIFKRLLGKLGFGRNE